MSNIPAQIHLGLDAVAVWPEGQRIEACAEPAIQRTVFADAACYHPRLTARILSLVEHERQRRRYFPGACGTKLHHVARLGCSEAELLDARARELFRRVLGKPAAVVDLSWANVYRRGDYCMPHSHIRATASVVYCLDVGDEGSEDPHGGRLSFVDPRLVRCCQKQPHCMTTPFLPEMMPGSMLIFPGRLVHCVNPYGGERPRITLSWNINAEAIPGPALETEDSA
jgi:hypothetical protein